MKATRINSGLYQYKGYTIGECFGSERKWAYIKGTGLREVDKFINGDVCYRDKVDTLREAKEIIDYIVDKD